LNEIRYQRSPLLENLIIDLSVCYSKTIGIDVWKFHQISEFNDEKELRFYYEFCRNYRKSFDSRYLIKKFKRVSTKMIFPLILEYLCDKDKLSFNLFKEKIDEFELGHLGLIAEKLLRNKESKLI